MAQYIRYIHGENPHPDSFKCLADLMSTECRVGCCFLAGFWLGFFSASGVRPYSSAYRPFIFEASSSGLSPSYASCSSHLF